MEMMNAIGYLDDIDNVSMEIVKQGSMHIVNALNEINQNDFTVLMPKGRTSSITDLSFVRQYRNTRDHADIVDKAEKLMDIFGIEREISKKYADSDTDHNKISDMIRNIYDQAAALTGKLKEARTELAGTKEFCEHMRRMMDVNIDLGAMKDLKFFSFRIGRLKKENYARLMDNIENISSIIYRINTLRGYEVIVAISPKILEAETARILSSLNFEKIDIPYDLTGTPREIIEKLGRKIDEKENEIKDLNSDILLLGRKYRESVDESYTKLKLLEKAQDVNNEVACTDEFFYLAGWVPVSEKQNLQKRLSRFGDRLTLAFKPQSEVNSSLIPPTKLKNNWLFRPFEAIVRMYGTPSYNELDPTAFVAVSYMIMFGCMFGDLGQGLIFLIAGLLLEHKFRHPNLGGVLSRVGLSSMFFGLLFGSVFGNENLIKPLLFHPMESKNINTILLLGIVLGIAFTTVSFIFSLINSFRKKDMENGLFGKNGAAGFVFYWIMIITAVDIFIKGKSRLPIGIIAIILFILLLFMMIKQPFSHIISGRKPLYDDPVGDYYIENGFGAFETIISMLSNTVSFIRIGAFALNHVGLFMAFATIAAMMSNGAEAVFILVLGNIVVMCLEGMVVFIQGLRLEYYELFSKYYEGKGIEYIPVKVIFDKTNTPISTSER